MQILLFLATLVLFGQPALAASRVEVSWRYERADNARTESGSRSIEIPPLGGPGLVATDPGIEKTIFLAQTAQTLVDFLDRYENACPAPVRSEIGRVAIDCATPRMAVASALRTEIQAMDARILANPRLRVDQDVVEVLDLTRSLAANMAQGHAPVGGYSPPQPAPLHGALYFAARAGGGGLALGGGGAQGFGYFRKLVRDGSVPKADVLTVEGFLREFSLPLTRAEACSSLVCVNPAVAVDSEKRRLYVQLGMSSNVTEEAFRRDPLNLAVVLDVSGSMGATDGTEKSRLEWAKDALIRTIEELDEQDMLSIVLFETNSEILVRPAPVRDKPALIAKVRALQTRGSTNLEAGLRDGFTLVRENVDRLPGYEHRVILISDAGLNTGVTDTASLERLVTEQANARIGLTALGVGENFHQSVIHAITNSRGGNYLFVQSGEDMLRYFRAFDYLVTPVAYDFNVAAFVQGLGVEHVRSYGVTTEGGAQPSRNLIDLKTLFFTETGGAILLEYALPQAR
ncbi:vWA domain-containing protein [Polyangium jinanense]|uniref:VWA domain-containing protein n=1 Tax=Polyangium jinanense TaxID=2829994 RepID=A0A9X4AYF3_9BACT|nr:VWA domain-containing protein [Polyangium jinanense]MDC3962593.1 VWA domain-containing protein [Polyangium jinanense]MDC3988731.1 VWA domain-containing protein [Polyangium jinanense]